MSVRTSGYNLRARPDAGVAEQRRSEMATDRLQEPLVLAQDLPPHMAGPACNTDPTVALYSDIVASRPPSPRKEIASEASIASSAENDCLESGILVENDAVPSVPNRVASSGEEPHEHCNNDFPWTTVKRRRAHSHSPLSEAHILSRRNSKLNRKLTAEQARAIRIATSNMTAQQKETLHRRQNNVPFPRDSSLSSRGEGPSRPKGKGVDPREWGGANVSQDSLDIEAQAAALESISYQQEASRRRHKKTVPEARHRTEVLARLPTESRPVAQLAANSYLGTALRNVGHSPRQSHQNQGGLPPSPSSPSSGDEGSTYSAGEPDGSLRDERRLER